MSTKLSASKPFFYSLLLLLMPLLINAQQITGKIISKNDQSVITGASVEVKGSSKGTAAGTDGTFSISAKMGDVLIVSAMGFKQVQYTVDKTAIIIELDADSKSLNEVVVTALGVKKRNQAYYLLSTGCKNC